MIGEVLVCDMIGATVAYHYCGAGRVLDLHPPLQVSVDAGMQVF